MAKIYRHFFRSGKPFYFHPLFLPAVLLFLMLTDAMTLYSIIDEMFYQSPLLSYVITSGLALSLEMLPVLIARMVKLQLYFPSRQRRVCIILAAAAYGLLFALTFYLRVSTRSLMFGDHSHISIGGEVGSDAVSDEPEGALAITILLGCLPFITSVVAFLLEYLTGDPIRAQYEAAVTAKASAKEKLAALRARICTYENPATEEMLRLFQKERYDAESARIKQTEAVIKEEARLLLMKKLGDADSINYICDQDRPTA